MYIIPLMKPLALFVTLLFVSPTIAEHYQENVSVEMVQVYITAKDSDQRFITDLRAEDLVIHEDGRIQEILDFTNLGEGGDVEGTPPLTVAFSMDISGSMSGLSATKEKKIDLAKRAALSMVSELQPSDRMTVFGFHSLPKIIVPMTSDAGVIKARLQLQHAEDQETALFDSLYIIVEQLKTEPGRKIIVLGTDGEDTSSHVKFETILQALKESDVTLFAFGMDSLDPSARDNRYVLNKLADATGGYAFFPKDDKELEKVVAMIRKIIRSQYSVWYTPQNAASSGNWRKIQVTCKRPGVELRYRNGYYSAKEQTVNAASH